MNILDEILSEKYSSSSRRVINDRIFAAILDYALFFVFTFFYVRIFGEKISEGTYTVRGPLSALPLFFWFLYFVVLEKIMHGTFGKQMLGLKVISMDGSSISFVQVLKRRLSDFIDFWWCLGLVGIILVKNTQYHQRLGDIWAKTIVVGKND